MKVIYRITDIKSTNPSPVFPNDKYRLNKFCLKSFLKAFESVNYSITFLCDYCNPETIDMIKELCPNGEIVQTAIGINETMLMAYEIAYNQDDDILFQECDYYWLPNTGISFKEGLRFLGLVSPYDHKNFYIDQSIHSQDQKITLVNDHHWRTTERNTMSFAIKKLAFEDLYGIMKNYGYLDNDVWHASRAKGYYLWTPIPTFATHMVTDYLSPSINWGELWKI